jgi:hypothetical protein
MEYDEFLESGWPYNQMDKNIVDRWRAAGKPGTPSLRDLNHIRYRLMFESDRFPRLEDATASWFPVPSPRSMQNPLVSLHVEPGSRFFLAPDRSPVDYREITAMGIMRWAIDRKWDEIEQFFDYCQRRKITAIRPLLNLGSPYWKQKNRLNLYTEGDTFWSVLVPLAERAAKYGLYTRFCLFGGIEPFITEEVDYGRRPDAVSNRADVIARMHSFLDQAVGTLRDVPSVLFEVANEPSQIGFGYDSKIILELGDHCHDLAPDRLMNYGAPCDEDNLFYMTGKADFFDEHLRRMKGADYLMSVKRLIEHTQVDMTKMPFMSGEWMNLGEGAGTESTATAFSTAAMLRLKHCIPAFHAHCLLEPAIPDPATDACLQAWTRGLDMIPITVSGVPTNGHWQTSPFYEYRKQIFPQTEDSTPQHNGPVRIFGRTQPDGSYLGLSIREPSGYELPGSAETLHIERWGDWQSRLVQV